ncbi:MAG: hypothetical protein FWG66_01540 [Spirochaetes bacterium]|nr:hypothetical protein [Spirochaetota bacterium]
MRRKFLCLVCLVLCLGAPLWAQTHNSVSMDNHVYHILENAVLRGLISPLSGIRPYSRHVVVRAINEILNSDSGRRGLTAGERAILRGYLDRFSMQAPGFDWQRGAHRSVGNMAGRDIPLSLNIGVGFDIEGGAGLYPTLGQNFFSNETWVRVHASGDVGRHVSWFFGAEGGMLYIPRRHLGYYWTFYEGFQDHGGYQNQLIRIYSQPLTHFPFSYRMRWDGSIHPLSDASLFESWPYPALSGARHLLSDVAVSLLDDRLFFRAGRLNREWGSTPHGASLGLNQASMPFVAVQGEFWPVPWFGIASMTGVLEFFNTHGEKPSGMTFQNAYSITMLQFRFSEFFLMDLGGAVIWPRRFELGYMFPLTTNIFYKNNVGDFDNLSAHLNLVARYPGLGSAWFSLFWDEAFWVSNFHYLDRTMLAWQVGLSFPVPVLSFSSLRISYTRINPYTFSHVRNFVPWYGGNIPMEQATVNRGVSLGYPTPPNSDEILVSFRTVPRQDLTLQLQYQLIRHGANFGSSAVDGSHLLSELDPHRDGTNLVTRRFFLRDGAYQWMHIARVNATWNLPGVPVSLFGEAGVVYSFFTNINAPANITGRAHSFSRINTDEYPQSTGIIFRLGVRIFPH